VILDKYTLHFLYVSLTHHYNSLLIKIMKIVRTVIKSLYIRYKVRLWQVRVFC